MVTTENLTTNFNGLSSDTKPTTARNGDTFYEMDTSTLYAFDADGGEWLSQESGGGGGGGGSTDDSFAKLIDGSIVNAVIPDGVTTIKAYIFRDCANLESVSIPESVTEIGASAFALCESLTSITIPSRVTQIGGNAFSFTAGESSLTEIICEATTPPEISNSTFKNLPTPFQIFVPAESVDAYKAASGWGLWASYIQAIGSDDEEDVGM